MRAICSKTTCGADGVTTGRLKPRAGGSYNPRSNLDVRHLGDVRRSEAGRGNAFV